MRTDRPERLLIGCREAIRCRRCQHIWLDRSMGDSGLASPHNGSLIPEAARRERLRRREQHRAAPATRRTGDVTHWLALTGFTMAFAAAILFWPQQVVSAFPAAARLYQKVGIEVNQVGLALERVRSHLVYAGGVPSLRVNGTIANVSQVARQVPELRFTLRDTAGQSVFTWSEPVSDLPLLPGARITFSTKIAAPPELAQKVEIRFNRIGDAPMAMTDEPAPN